MESFGGWFRSSAKLLDLDMNSSGLVGHLKPELREGLDMSRSGALLTGLVFAITLCSCASWDLRIAGGEQHEKGPPDHAPAHGHRAHRDAGIDLIWKADLDVYSVSGRSGTYYDDGIYFRISSGVWVASASIDGPWRSRDEAGLPPGLRKKSHAKHEKHRGRGKGPAKHGW
jgi:hypothetical protein